MRISDWSSDVCSSDLGAGDTGSEAQQDEQRNGGLCRHGGGGEGGDRERDEEPAPPPARPDSLGGGERAQQVAEEVGGGEDSRLRLAEPDRLPPERPNRRVDAPADAHDRRQRQTTAAPHP